MDPASQCDADDSTRAGQSNGFGEELANDVPSSSADRFTHSDFASALRHRHKHDIHHTNSADEEANGTDHDHRNGNRSRDLAELARKSFRTGNSKIIRLVYPDGPSPPHQANNFVLCLRLSARICLRTDKVFIILRIVFAVCTVRNDHNFIRRLIFEELPFAFLQHPDNLVISASDLDGLAQRIFLVKQTRRQIVAYHGHVHVMEVFCFAEEAPFFWIRVVDPFVRWGGTGELNAVNFVAFVARRNHRDGPAGFDPRRNLHSYIFYVGALIPDRHSVFPGERLAVAFFGCKAASESEVKAKNE